MLAVFAMHRPSQEQVANQMLRDRDMNGNAASTTGRAAISGRMPALESLHIQGTTTRETSSKVPPKEDILYPKGPIGSLPEEFESRRERFEELDSIQPGWTLELRKRRAGSAVEAIFFAPSGTCFTQS